MATSRESSLHNRVVGGACVDDSDLVVEGDDRVVRDEGVVFTNTG